MKRYKVLKEGMISPFQNFKYEIGKKYVCKDFDDDKNEDCSNGFYATGIEGILYTNLSNNKKVYECEVSGKSVEIDQFKMRYQNLKIIREIPMPELKKLVKAESDKLGYDLYHALFPINPLEIKRTGKVTDHEKALLKQWIAVRYSVRDSVRDSVGDSARDSVRDSVRYSVGDSVGYSVGYSVGDSVWASVWASVWDSARAYISSLFPGIKKWKYIEYEGGKNPFQSCIDLWHIGLVPSFDGKTWRLHAGKGAKIVYELKEK